MVQGHCAERQFNPLLLRLLNISFVFTAEHYNVACSSNSYSFEIDGLLAGGRRQHTGLQACHFSALHPLDTKYEGPDENSYVPQPVSYFHRNNRHDVIDVSDLGNGRNIGQLSDTELVYSPFWKRASRNGELRWSNTSEKRHQQRKEDIRKRSFPPLGYGKECCQQAPLVVMREGPSPLAERFSTLDSEDVVTTCSHTASRVHTVSA